MGIPLGFGLLWEIIVPKIIEISERVGCKYLYLFAVDKSDGEETINSKRLVKYYRNEFIFHECRDGIKLVKPDYDNYCYGLIQEISSLEKNRENVWEEYSVVTM